MRCVASYAATQRLYFVAVQMLSVLQRCRKPVRSCAAAVFAVPPPKCRISTRRRMLRVVRRALRSARQAVSVAAPRLRALVATRGQCSSATHPGRCGRRRAKAATCKESATLYVAKRRAKKPVVPQASCRPQGSPGSGPGQLELPRPLLASEAVPSEDAGFLSHVHTDRPLGRPRGPLLQQHVGLLVAAPPRLCAPRPCSSSTATPAVDYLKA